jgi:protein involved in polysaccharide export with SLBB domain
MRQLRILLFFLGAGAGASLAVAAPANAQTAAASARVDSLRVGDVLKLWIWREEEMSGEFAVPETGVVVLPKIGPRKVVGQHTADLKQALITEYQKYLRNPAIEITFLRRVNVLGAVNEPGVFSLDETMTVAHALALAGGARPDGRTDEVQLFRDGQKLVGKISQRTRIADLQIRSGDQLFVPERSWVARNTGLVAALVSGAVSVTIALIASK